MYSWGTNVPGCAAPRRCLAKGNKHTPLKRLRLIIWKKGVILWQKNNSIIQLLVRKIVVSASTGCPDCPFVNESFVLRMILFHNSFANHFQSKKAVWQLINPFVTVSQSITSHLQKWHFYGVIYQMAPRVLHGEVFLLKVREVKSSITLMRIV